MGIVDRPLGPRSPWQNRYIERPIGSIKCEGLNCAVVCCETRLHRILMACAAHSNGVRTYVVLE